MREIFGILGTIPQASELLSAFDAHCTQQGIDACLVKYPTTVETLPERLSEMFHFDRRAYILEPSLHTDCIPLLDAVDLSNAEANAVNVLVNNAGVFQGKWIPDFAGDHIDIDRCVLKLLETRCTVSLL